MKRSELRKMIREELLREENEPYARKVLLDAVTSLQNQVRKLNEPTVLKTGAGPKIKSAIKFIQQAQQMLNRAEGDL